MILFPLHGLMFLHAGGNIYMFWVRGERWQARKKAPSEKLYGSVLQGGAGETTRFFFFPSTAVRLGADIVHAMY
jgi:hypothetical protein